jgi:hypothetical protein
MATRREIFFIRDSTGALVDSGGALAWAQFAIRNSDGTLASSSGPSFTDRGTGIAEFEVTLTSGQYAYGEVTITAPGVGPITYGPVTYADLLTPATSSDIPSAATVATQVDTTLSASHGSGAWGGAAGDGARSVTVTVQTAAASAVPGARAYIFSGSTLVAGPLTTNSSGQATFSLDDGSYVVRSILTGYTIPDKAITVSSGSTSFTATATQGTSELAQAPVGVTRAISIAAPSHGEEIRGFVEGDGPTTFTRTISGVPAGKTIASGYFTVKAPDRTGVADARAQVQVAVTVTDSGADTSGEVTWTLTAAQAAGLRGKRWRYDLQLTLSDSAKTTPETGEIELVDGVTQS